MFALRCLGVSSAIFVIVYGLLSLAVAGRWRFLLRLLAPRSARSTADALFVLRSLPWMTAALVTAVFTLPSFILLEPRSSDEVVGTVPTLLGGLFAVVLIWGMFRAVRAQLASSAAIDQWLQGSMKLESDYAVPVFQTRRNSPTLTVAGLCAPKVLVSEETLGTLSPSELRAAMKHELAHVRRYDNLKKMTFRVSAFPGMRPLEQKWAEESELAADDAAVSSRMDALDLASALIKVSKLASVRPPELCSGLLHSSTALSLRIHRLFSWEELGSAVGSRRRLAYALTPAVVMMIWMWLSYGSILTQMHMLTEWLVR